MLKISILVLLLERGLKPKPENYGITKRKVATPTISAYNNDLT